MQCYSGVYHKLFVDSQDANILRDDPHRRLYEQRCMSLAGGGDIVVLSHPLDPRYLSYLSDMGLPLPAVYVVGSSGDDLVATILANPQHVKVLKRAIDHGEWVLQPFLWSHSLFNRE